MIKINNKHSSILLTNDDRYNNINDSLDFIKKEVYYLIWKKI